MPRVSDKRLLIEWFLETLQPELRESQHVRFKDFLLRQTKSMVSTVRTALTESACGQLELKDELRKSLISESISLSNNYSEISTFSILSEIEERVNEKIRNHLLQRKMKVLRTLLSIRYMYSRMNQVPKSNTFRNEVISALPLDRFRHFFRMNPDSYLKVLDRIENHQVFKNKARMKQVKRNTTLIITKAKLL